MTGRKADTSKFLAWKDDRSGSQVAFDRDHIFSIRGLRENGQFFHFLVVARCGAILYRRGFRTSMAAKFAAEGFRRESPSLRGVV